MRWNKTKLTKRKNLCQGLTPTKRWIGTSTFKSYGENLKTFKLHTWSKGAQSLQKLEGEIVLEVIPWKDEMEGQNETITTNKNEL